VSGRLKYFAYGSNLHPERLLQRVPSARVIGPAVIEGYRLAFNKRGADNSGKCNVMLAGAKARVHGALFHIDAPEKAALDRAEGGYEVRHMNVLSGGESHQAFSYIAQPQNLVDELHPYDWYHSLVMTGGRYHDLPAAYLEQIAIHPVQCDADAERAYRNAQLLERMAVNPRSA
jgi:gamma-glutamylcyclotransferase